MSVKNDNKYDLRDSFGCITSQGGLYKIHVNKQLNSDRPGVIYVKKDHPVQYSFLRRVKSAPSPSGYSCYQYAGEWNKKSNDCLDFAESLANNQPGIASDECTFSEPITNMIFGDDDQSNADIVSALKTNHSHQIDDYAKPDIGQSYAFVLHHKYTSSPKLPDIVPFHIAYVMFQDGTTNITLEANAGANLTNPLFDMYDTRKCSQNTFHKVAKAIYTAGYAERKYQIGDKDYISQEEYINKYMDNYTTIVLGKKQLSASKTRGGNIASTQSKKILNKVK